MRKKNIIKRLYYLKHGLADRTPDTVEEAQTRLDELYTALGNLIFEAKNPKLWVRMRNFLRGVR